MTTETVIHVERSRDELVAALKIDGVVAAQLSALEVVKMDPETMTPEDDALLVDRMTVMVQAVKVLEDRKRSILRPFMDAVAGLRAQVDVEIQKITAGRIAGDAVVRRRKQLRAEAEARAAAAARAAAEIAAQQPVRDDEIAPPPAVVATPPSSRRIEGAMGRAATRRTLMVKLTDAAALAAVHPELLELNAQAARRVVAEKIAATLTDDGGRAPAVVPGLEWWYAESEVYQRR